MAQLYFTSTDLLASIKRRASVPSSQNLFTDEDLLAFANEEIDIGLVPSIMRLHEDYLLYIQNVPFISGVRSYELPERAIGNKLRDVYFKTSDNNRVETTRINVEDISNYNGTYYNNRMFTYYLLNNTLEMLPNQTPGNGTLEFYYYIRPNRLVKTDRTAEIRSIDRTTGVITLKTVPTVFSTTELFDLVSSKSPHKTLLIDMPILNMNTTLKTVTVDPTLIPTTLRVGDFLNLAKETSIPQVPSDLHAILAHRVAMRCLEAMGDNEGLSIANAKLQEMEDRTGNLIDNRVEGSPQKVINRNGILRNGLLRRNRRVR
jgi:hypothetical protein